jgi:hypothetical protein
MPMQQEILNEIHNNPVIQSNPVVSSVSYALGWIGSGLLLFIGSIGEATDVVRFTGAIGGLVMLFISLRKSYIDNQIKKTELKIKKLEAKKLEKDINGSSI